MASPRESRSLPLGDDMWRSARTQTRANLADIIPLATPYQLVIDVTNLCNFGCSFCPTGHPDLLKGIDRPSGMMDFDLFCKIVDDMRQFPAKFKRIDFGKDGEQTLHPRLPEMIAYLKNADVTELIGIATNAARLTRELSDDLVAAGLDLLKVSVEAVSDEGYRRIARRHFDYQQLLERVAYLYQHRGNCKVYAKIIDYGLTDDEKFKFYEDFTSISDYITVDYVSGWSVTSAIDLKQGYSHDRYLDLPSRDEKEVCPFPFYTLSINFNGTVSVCCVDWSWSTLVGDLRQESLRDLWNGERLFRFREMHLRRAGFDNKACRDCDARGGLPDNIDAYADNILKRLTAART